jgi:hypothetical protein
MHHSVFLGSNLNTAVGTSFFFLALYISANSQMSWPWKTFLPVHPFWPIPNQTVVGDSVMRHIDGSSEPAMQRGHESHDNNYFESGVLHITGEI